MKNFEEYKNIFEEVIRCSKSANASDAVKNYLLSLDYETVQLVQVAMYLGDDEKELERTTNLWEKLEYEIAQNLWFSDKELEVRHISDKCEGKLVGEALERIMNKLISKCNQ